MNKAYHFGYHGHKPEELLAAVKELGAVVCDIRLTPFSRWQPGWNRKSLQAMFGDAYVHVPELGNLNYKGGGRIEIADMDAGLKALLGLLEEKPVVLMCVCREFERCHRSVIADRLHRKGGEVEELLLSSQSPILHPPPTPILKKSRMSKSIEAPEKTTQQLRLIELELDKAATLNTNGSSVFKDPAFASNKTKAVHRWVPWIAGFSHDFVHGSIIKYLDRKGVVLDPFAGVGTTLVEAVLSLRG